LVSSWGVWKDKVTNQKETRLVEVRWLNTIRPIIPEPKKESVITERRTMMDESVHGKLFYENGCIVRDGHIVEKDVSEQDIFRDENGNISHWLPKQSYRYEGNPPVMQMEGETLCFWSDDSDEKQAHYETLQTNSLIYYADYAEYIDDTMPVIRALYKRDPDKAIELTKAILELGKAYGELDEEAKAFLKEKGFEV
jgi:hypothetical protein